MADVFLSYSSEDRPTAQAIAQALSARGMSVWWDRSIRAGEDFFDVIESQLDLATCVVVLWSKASVASRWVRAEATEALKQGKLIPLLVGECRPPLVFRQIQVLSIDSAGRLDSASSVDALEHEVRSHLSNLEELDKLPVLPPPASPGRTPSAGRISAPASTPDDIVRAFLDGAGLSWGGDELGDLERLFRDIGQIVREAIEGAGNFLRSQVYFKTELRIERTMIAPRSNNPLKFVSSYGDAAKLLLLQRSEAFMDGPAALRDALQDAQDSYLSQITAMRASVLKAFELLEASAADKPDEASEQWWPWAETRRLREVLLRHAQELSTVRQAFADGEGPIFDAYSQAYLSQMSTLRAERSANGKDGAPN